jgi:hypothetical protein
MNMTMSTILTALLRHLLTTAGGGFLVTWGLSGTTLDAVIGAVSTLAGVAWSMYDKKTTADTAAGFGAPAA